jgi:MFS family permease
VWLSLATSAAWLPAIIGSPLGGVAADRWRRQRWIQVNNAIQAITAITLAICQLSGHLTPSIAVCLALIEGLASSSSWAAWQSLLPDLVERSEVLAAVSLSSAQFNLGRIVGPVVAAGLLALGPPGWCFAANAASFVVVVIAFAFVRSAPRPPVKRTFQPWREIVIGARSAVATETCRNAIGAIAIIAFLLSPFITFLPHMSVDVLHVGKVGTAILVACQGIGAFGGALLNAEVVRRTSRLTVLLGSLVTLIVSLVAYALSPTLWFAGLMMVIVGMAYIGTLTGLNTSVQLTAPAQTRARILSLYTLALSVGYPVGAFVQSWFVKRYGVRIDTIAASVVASGVLIYVVALRRQLVTALGRTATAA